MTNNASTTFAGFPPSFHTLCPMCDYCLEGLPAEHNCPECGRRYDANTRMWKWPIRRWQHGFLWSSLFTSVAFAVIFATSSSKTLRILQTYNVLMFTFSAASVLWLAIRARKSYTSIGLTPDGIVRRGPILQRSFVAWSSVEGAKIVHFRGTTSIKYKFKSAFMWPLELFLDAADAHAIVAEIQERIATNRTSDDANRDNEPGRI